MLMLGATARTWKIVATGDNTGNLDDLLFDDKNRKVWIHPLGLVEREVHRAGSPGNGELREKGLRDATAGLR